MPPMSACCPHPEVVHTIDRTCEQVIHYPSEDYPCLCGTGFIPGEDPVVCRECGHSPAKHVKSRVCKPASGEYCVCRQIIG
jgi:hypothetical protein